MEGGQSRFTIKTLSEQVIEAGLDPLELGPASPGPGLGPGLGSPGGAEGEHVISILQWICKGLVVQLPRRGRQQLSEPEPWRG